MKTISTLKFIIFSYLAIMCSQNSVFAAYRQWLEQNTYLQWLEQDKARIAKEREEKYRRIEEEIEKRRPRPLDYRLTYEEYNLETERSLARERERRLAEEEERAAIEFFKKREEKRRKEKERETRYEHEKVEKIQVPSEFFDRSDEERLNYLTGTNMEIYDVRNIKNLEEWLNENNVANKLVVTPENWNTILLAANRLSMYNDDALLALLVKKNVYIAKKDIGPIIASFIASHFKYPDDPVKLAKRLALFDQLLDILMLQGFNLEEIEKIIIKEKERIEISNSKGGNQYPIDAEPYLNFIAKKIPEQYKKEIESAHKPLLDVLIPLAVLKQVLAPSDPRILAFKHAIEDNDLEALKKALGAQNENLFLQDQTGYSPLLYAVYIDKPEMITYLRPIIQAAIKQNEEQIKKLEETMTNDELKKLETEKIQLSKTRDDEEKNSDRIQSIQSDIDLLNSILRHGKTKIDQLKQTITRIKNQIQNARDLALHRKKQYEAAQQRGESMGIYQYDQIMEELHKF